MSVIATAMRHLMAAGVTGEALCAAVADMEAAITPARSKGAERQARYEERQRQKASESVRPDVPDVRSPPLSLSPQTPLTHTPPPGDILPAREGLSRAEVTRGFAGFWEAYPRKVGKDAASKAYDRAIRRIGGAQAVQVIVDGLRRALPGWDDPDFIPHPTTWLNQGRWGDEAPTTRTGPRNDRSNANPRADARSVWADVIAESHSQGPGTVQPVRLAG